MATSLINNASSGIKNDIFLSFTIKPENNAIAITGEKPDQFKSGPKKNLQAVATAARIIVKMINRPFFMMFKLISFIMLQK